MGVSLHMRASIKSVNHAAIWQRDGEREGEWKLEKRNRERERVGDRLGSEAGETVWVGGWCIFMSSMGFCRHLF